MLFKFRVVVCAALWEGCLHAVSSAINHIFGPGRMDQPVIQDTENVSWWGGWGAWTETHEAGYEHGRDGSDKR